MEGLTRQKELERRHKTAGHRRIIEHWWHVHGGCAAEPTDENIESFSLAQVEHAYAVQPLTLWWTREDGDTVLAKCKSTHCGM